MIYGFAYAGFQVIYILAFDLKDDEGNDYIYDILKWKTNPGKAAGTVAMILVMMIFAHGFLCFLAFVRDKIWETCARKTEGDEYLPLTNPKNYDSMNDVD